MLCAYTTLYSTAKEWQPHTKGGGWALCAQSPHGAAKVEWPRSALALTGTGSVVQLLKH